jgi:phage shock protein PspC (stress-responsive transcriptional regulator)
VNDRLYRSRDERMFAGVAGGVAERLDLDPSLVRVVWVILMFLSGGLFFLLYIVMAILVPEAPTGGDRWAAWSSGVAAASAPPPGPGAVPGWSGPTPGGEALVPAAAAAGAAPGSGGTGESEAAGAAAGATAAAEGAAAAAEGATPPSGPPDVAPPGSPPPGTPFVPAPPPAGPAWGAAPPPYRHREHRGEGAIIGGIILVLLGAFFLVQSLAPQIDWGPFWPVILVVIGIALVIGSVRPGRGDSPG